MQKCKYYAHLLDVIKDMKRLYTPPGIEKSQKVPMKNTIIITK